MKLTGKQRSKLRSLGHSLEPVITIGKNGVTDELVKATDEAVEIHELIKVRFSDHQDEKDELIQQLSEKVSADVAGKSGHTALIYRPAKDPAKRRVKLD